MISQIFGHGALKKRIAENRKKLYQAAYSWCHDPQLSDDLAHEAMIKALEGLSSLKEPRYLDTWLYRILINVWRDHLRQRKDIVDFDDSQFRSSADLVEDFHQQDLSGRVKKAMSDLPVSLREIVSLADISGLTYQQLAEVLDIPEGTVMSRLFRARKQLQAALYDLKSPENNVTELRRSR